MAGWIVRLKEVAMEFLLIFDMRQPNGTAVFIWNLNIRICDILTFDLAYQRQTREMKNVYCLLFTTSQILSFESLMAIFIFNDISIKTWFQIRTDDNISSIYRNLRSLDTLKDSNDLIILDTYWIISSGLGQGIVIGPYLHFKCK